MTRSPWRAVPLGVCVACVAGVTACAGGSSNAGLSSQVIVAATSGANTTKFVTVVTFGSGKSRTRIETSGSVDFTKQRGDVTTRLLPRSSTTSASTESTSSETRWIGDHIYAKGTGGIVGDGTRWAFVDAAKVHSASSCLPKYDVVSLLTGSGSEGPSGALDALRKKGKHLQRVGTDTIRGVTTTHWRVAPEVWPSVHCNITPTSRHTTVRVGVDIWTDRQDRARRLNLSQTQTTKFLDKGPNGSHTPNTDTQTTAVTTDFFDFGSAVDVQTPPRDQVDDETDAFIAVMLGPGSIKASDWHEAAHGTIGAKPWKIDAARTTTGWYCYDATDVPQNKPSGITETSNGFPKHNGHLTDCTVPGGLLSMNGPVSVLLNTTNSGRHIIVGAVSGVGAAHIVFQDGSAQSLSVDPNTLIFNWSGPASHVPVRIRVGDQSCRVDSHGNDSLQGTYGLRSNADCIGVTP